MKKTMLLMIFPLLLLAAILLAEPRQLLLPASDDSALSTEETHFTQRTVAASPEYIPAAPETETVINDKADDIVSYAMTLIGSPYVYGGITAEGFDCSGFITHVFSQYEVDVPHSSAMQAEEGIYVSPAEAQVGDIVIFTGTNPAVREPGHAGIVISSPGDTIEFVHSSSNGGVKVSQVEGTGYERRFLQVRRILQ